MSRRIVAVPSRSPAGPPSACCPWLPCAVMLGVLVLTACSSHHSAPVAADTSTSASDTGSADEHDPCSLLDPKDVEAVLGAPLATAPFRTTGGAPSDDGGQCAYEDAHFHRIVVDVDWDGATMSWKMLGNLQSMVNQGPTKGMLHLADGSDIAGTWDEARVQGCCEFATLLGDQGVTIDASDSSIGIPAAAKLADAALERLDKPLPIDGNGGVGPARTYEAAHRPQHRDPCSFLTRAEAEAIIGALSADPKANGDSCEYDRTIAGPMGNLPAQLVIYAHWAFGYQELRENASIRQGFVQGFSAGLPGGKKVAAALSGGALPASPYWEVAYAGATRAGGLAAVKNDVIIGVDGLAVPREQMLAVLEKAMSKL